MNVTIASAQYPVTFHASFDAWVQHTGAWVRRALPHRPHLLLFPEYGSLELVSLLPPGERADLRAQVRGLDRLRDDFCAVFAGLARKHGVIIAAPSFPVRAGEAVFNRCFVFGPSGKMGYQDKYFMTRFELEEWEVRRSAARWCVFEADCGCFGIQICYDIEFPLGAALLCGAGAQVLLAPSCTETIRGSTRVHVGARARALEQQCYTVVSPLVGDAPWSPAVDINYGHAAFYATPDRNLPAELAALQLAAPQQFPEYALGHARGPPHASCLLWLGVSHARPSQDQRDTSSFSPRGRRWPRAAGSDEGEALSDARRTEAQQTPHPSGFACHLLPQREKEFQCSLHPHPRAGLAALRVDDHQPVEARPLRPPDRPSTDRIGGQRLAGDIPA